MMTSNQNGVGDGSWASDGDDEAVVVALAKAMVSTLGGNVGG